MAAPTLKIDNLIRALGVAFDGVKSVQIRLSLDGSSAATATEVAGVGMHEATDTNAISIGVGHDGTNYIFRGQRATWFHRREHCLDRAGSGAVLGMEYTPNACQAYNGAGVAVAPPFVDMTLHGKQSGSQLPLCATAARQWWLHSDLYLHSAETNAAGTLQTVFRRSEIWFVEATLP